MSKFRTASGKFIDILNMQPGDVSINDIAHSLSKIQRFGGATPLDKSYTVGEHSINLSIFFSKQVGSTQLALYALIHDSTEAYLSDIISPVKKALPDYIKLEDKILRVILRGLNLPYDEGIFKRIKESDKRILIDEAAAIMPETEQEYREYTKLEPLCCEIVHSYHCSAIKYTFLQMYKKLRLIYRGVYENQTNN